ncbi:MAG: hypothetical protein JXB04_10870 [Kiritimatiellae bacterium]|nr:hypothetical protein [Kiritimatiellia bacterium]
MDPAVRLFCSMAVERGYVTQTQCRIFEHIYEGRLSLGALLDMMEAWNVGRRFAVPMQELAEEIQGLSEAEIADRIRERGLSRPDSAAEVPLEMEWFCFLAIRDGLLTEEQCLELDAELGREHDYLDFAQAVAVILPADAFPRIQRIVERVLEFARTGYPPPVRVFAGGSAGDAIAEGPSPAGADAPAEP